MKLKEAIRRLILVHKCVGCGEILVGDQFDRAYCPSCRLSWNAALTENCGKCMKPAVECTCMPKAMSKEGALCLRRLFFYESEDVYTPSMSMIYWLKRKKSRRITGFVAEQLLPVMKEQIEILGEDGEKFVFCAVPRGRRSLTNYGFDHAALVARALAERLGAEYSQLFDSTLFSKPQKELDQRGRFRNAEKRIRLSKKTDVRGRYVVIFDDMVTTGASMSVCVRLLRKAGARGVVCLALASSKKI